MPIQKRLSRQARFPLRRLDRAAVKLQEPPVQATPALRLFRYKQDAIRPERECTEAEGLVVEMSCVPIRTSKPQTLRALRASA